MEAIQIKRESLLMRAAFIPTSQIERELTDLAAEEAAVRQEMRANRTWADTFEGFGRTATSAAVAGVVGGVTGAVANIAASRLTAAFSPPAPELPASQPTRRFVGPAISGDWLPPGLEITDLGRVGGGGGSGPISPAREAVEVASMGAWAATGSIVGGVVGQGLIPIPGVGAAVGGAVGGIVGSVVGLAWNHATR